MKSRDLYNSYKESIRSASLKEIVVFTNDVEYAKRGNVHPSLNKCHVRAPSLYADKYG